jgi:hypothetical protein
MNGDTSMVVCEQCGCLRECECVPDPYMEEIHPEKENPPTWWCKDCYHSACMEI